MKTLIIFLIFLSCDKPEYENKNSMFIREKNFIPEWLHGVFVNDSTQEFIYGNSSKIVLYLDYVKYELNRQDYKENNSKEYHINDFIFINNDKQITLIKGENKPLNYNKK